MLFSSRRSVTTPVPSLLAVIMVLTMSGCGGPTAYREAYSDERPKVIGEQDGRVAVGTWSRYHSDGSLASLGGYRDGRQSGRWTYGHPGGIPAGVGHFTAGIQDGWWQIQDDHGKVTTAGLMAQGQRVGPWLAQRDGRLTSTVYTPIDHSPITPQITPDSITWQLDPETMVRFTAIGDAATISYVVDAAWKGAGSPLRLVLPDPDFGPWFLAQTKPVIPGPDVSATLETSTPHVLQASEPTQSNQPTEPKSSTLPGNAKSPGVANQEPTAPSGMPLDDSRSLAVSMPGVSLSPIPEQAPITGVYRFVADRFVAGFLAGTPVTTANAPQLAKEAPVGDPLGEALVGKPLPQTRFLTSSGGVLDLAQPAKPTVLVIMRGFSNSICLYCTSQTAAIMKAENEFKAAGVDIAILYPGSSDSVPKFLASARDMTEKKDGAKPFPVPVLLDVNLQLVRTLHIEGELARPTTLVIGVDGLVKWAYVGRSMSDRPTLKDVLAVALAKH